MNRQTMTDAVRLQTLYHYGDKARYTGKTETIHSGLFYEIEYLDGHRKGQLVWTARAPSDHPHST